MDSALIEGVAVAEQGHPAVAEPAAIGPLGAVSDWTNRACEVLTCALLAIMVVVVFADVIFRYVLNNSLIWGDELSRFLFIWITFLGSAIALKLQSMPSIRLVVDAAPVRLRPYLGLAADVLTGAFLLLLLVNGVQVSGQMGDQFSTALNLPMGGVHVVVPLAAVVMLVHLANHRLVTARTQAEVLLLLLMFPLAWAITQLPLGWDRALLPILLLGLFALNLPIAIVLGLTAFAVLASQHTAPLSVVDLRMFGGIDVTSLTAVPFFMLAGAIMAAGGMARRIVNFSAVLVGRFTGGLALADIVASLIFADISGSCVADTAALGTVMIPELTRRGYPRPYATGLQAAAGSLGMMFPPSITMILYAWVASISVAQLFLSSFVPGFLVVLSYGLVAYLIARRRGFPKEPPAGPRDVVHATRDGLFALLAPAIILGGIFSGTFTPTEAGVVAVVYTLVISLLVYRELNPRQLVETLLDTVVGTARVMFIVGTAVALGWLLATMQLPQALLGAVSGLSHNPVVVIILLNVVLMAIHTVLESSATLLVVVPIILPTLAANNIDPVFFGVVLVMNSALGLLMPPIGILIYIAAALSRITVERAARAVLPFVGALAVDLLIVIFNPGLVSWLPRVLYR